jgi:hypothetical protein
MLCYIENANAEEDSVSATTTREPHTLDEDVIDDHYHDLDHEDEAEEGRPEYHEYHEADDPDVHDQQSLAFEPRQLDGQGESLLIVFLLLLSDELSGASMTHSLQCEH